MSHNVIIPLEMLPSGGWAEIAEISGEAKSVGRMEEMGLKAGCRFQVLQPGSPCLLNLGGSRLSLRGCLNMQIMVRPVPAAGC